MKDIIRILIWKSMKYMMILLKLAYFLQKRDRMKYFSYGRLYGIIYVDVEKADSKREEVKNELVQEYKKNKEPTSEFVNEFCKKHKVSLPNDIFFDASELFDF
jgi:hypothetical protein